MSNNSENVMYAVDLETFVVYSKMRQLSDEASWLQVDERSRVRELYGDCDEKRLDYVIDKYARIKKDIDRLFGELLGVESVDDG